MLRLNIVKPSQDEFPGTMTNYQRRYFNLLKDRVGHRAEILGPYVNANTQINFRCKICGHEWLCTPKAIKQSSNCSICAVKNRQECKLDGLTIGRQIASERGGRLLSTSYMNNRSGLDWECANKHTWKAALGVVKDRKQWCFQCAGFASLTIEILREDAIQRGGKCLSEKYLGSGIHHLWECGQNHQWWSKPTHIRQGSWCPICNQSRGERNCKNVLQRMNIAFTEQPRLANNMKKPYDFSFQHNGKYWLLEIDGIQHFEYNSFLSSHCRKICVQTSYGSIQDEQALNAGYILIRIDYKQVECIYDILQDAFQEDTHCYLSDPVMYSWLFEGDNPVIISPTTNKMTRLKLHK